MTIIILGRQPSLGLAEIESLFGADRMTIISEHIIQLDIPTDQVTRHELGGSVKIAQLIAERPTTAWPDLMNYTKSFLKDYVRQLPEGKFKFGISDYGLGSSLPLLQKMSLRLKKTIQQQGRSVRAIPNADKYLNSAQIIHNKLTSPLGMELIYVRSGKATIIAQTVHEQNIENYTFRDRGRPMRDAYVGMLPPKLAQTMIHLAVAQGDTINSDSTPRILDPFCGTGVVLQEAALFGYSVYGTDLNEKMIRYTRDNLNWLQDTHQVRFEWYLEKADAQDAKWQQPIDHIVCEGYLGQPMSTLPQEEKLEEIVHGCNGIAKAFLKNLAPQVTSGSRHCIALPAWNTNQGFRHLPVIDDLEKLGYNRVSFVHATHDDLIYHRPDQIVARELLVLTRK